jgi:signal peptidase I
MTFPSRRNAKRVSPLRIVVAAVFIALIFKTFMLDLVIVRGDSMVPTIVPGTLALVCRSAYGIRLPFVGTYIIRWSNPFPGEIVLAEPVAGSNRRAVKRIFEVGPAYLLAEAGVLTGRGGSLPLNGAALTRLSGSTFIATGRIFLVGDNDSISYDSRDYGPVPIEKIVGKVLLCSKGRIAPRSAGEPSRKTVDDVSR